ncbi:MAG TPA: histidine phosphatase family protein [Bryobacteraceae bacterium]|nr:histidine phosphatase family protein [Bryobacteraceae bacterium]
MRIPPAVPEHGGRTRALIVRHAQSSFNVQQRCQGRSDEPILTDRGAAAAVRAGHHLVTEHVDALISSPLRRALQTAEIIAAILREGGQDQLRLNTDDDLMEIHLPEWEGLALEEIRQQFPEGQRIWSDQPHEFRMLSQSRSTVFPVRQLFEQAHRFWREFLRHYAGQTVVLVTHGGTARALISTAVGLKPERFHSLQQSNCGISTLEFPANSSTAQIEALNLTAHLGERMPKLKLGRRGARIVLVSGDTPRQKAAQISGILDALQLDFVLSADDPQSKEMAHALIHARPHAPLSVLPGKVLFESQHLETLPLAGPLTSSRHSLSTGVFVGRNSELDAMLSAVVGMDGRSSPWKHPSNAVLHYPATSQRPVIQAFNMPVWKEACEPVTTEAYS